MHTVNYGKPQLGTLTDRLIPRLVRVSMLEREVFSPYLLFSPYLRRISSCFAFLSARLREREREREKGRHCSTCAYFFLCVTISRQLFGNRASLIIVKLLCVDPQHIWPWTTLRSLSCTHLCEQYNEEFMIVVTRAKEKEREPSGIGQTQNITQLLGLLILTWKSTQVEFLPIAHKNGG